MSNLNILKGRFDFDPNELYQIKSVQELIIKLFFLMNLLLPIKKIKQLFSLIEAFR